LWKRIVQERPIERHGVFDRARVAIAEPSFSILEEDDARHRIVTAVLDEHRAVFCQARGERHRKAPDAAVEQKFLVLAADRHRR
jgi:hypothetical protein